MNPRNWATLLLALVSTSLSHAQVVQWDIERRRVNNGLHARSSASTLDAIITNKKSQGGYVAKVRLGTPWQNLTMLLDTGSSDAWVPYTGAAVCESSSSGCSLGSFDPEGSSTFEELAEDAFQITYGDSSQSAGDYFQDRFEIGGATLQNLTMGLGLETDISVGLIGLGYAGDEASAETLQETYANLPVALQQDGLINSVAYSLWLNDLDAATGSILFGGVDKDKYVGTLKKIDIQPSDASGNYYHFYVSLTSLEAQSPSGKDVLASANESTMVILDSGTTLSYLPMNLTQKLWDEVGAKYEATYGMAVLPCSYSSHSGHFSFGLGGSGGPDIKIYMDELVVDLTGGYPPQFTSGQYAGESVCEFGVQNSSTAPYVLGDTFLRSAYVVYDLENNQVGMAATNFSSTTSDIVAFSSKGATIPSAATAVANRTESSSSEPTSTTLAAADGFQQGSDSKGSNTRAPIGSWVGLFILSCCTSMAAMIM